MRRHCEPKPFHAIASYFFLANSEPSTHGATPSCGSGRDAEIERARTLL
jgi:hypothetical protein